MNKKTRIASVVGAILTAVMFEYKPEWMIFTLFTTVCACIYYTFTEPIEEQESEN